MLSEAAFDFSAILVAILAIAVGALGGRLWTRRLSKDKPETDYRGLKGAIKEKQQEMDSHSDSDLVRMVANSGRVTAKDDEPQSDTD